MAKFGIGQPVPRLEDPRFITGRGRYVDDIDMPLQCYGVLVMSPHAHARIKTIDTAAAKAAPGVLAVLTGADAEADRIGKPGADHAGGYGRPERLPHAPADPVERRRCGRSATASPLWWPRPCSRRATPPS